MSPPIDLAAIKARSAEAREYRWPAIDADVDALVAEVERLRAAAEWRSDEPPLLPYEGRDRSDPIEIHLRRSDERVVARVYRKWGDLLYLFGNWTPLGPVGADWKWRPIGPNPFDQEQT